MQAPCISPLPPRYRLAFLTAASLLFAPLVGATEAKRNDLSAEDIARVEDVTRPTNDFSRPEQYEAMPGGATTSRKPIDTDAFSHASANLGFSEEENFKLGNALFEKLWVSSPSSTQASDGLGPLFNARSCQSCHLNNGRGRPPESHESSSSSMILRLARPAHSDKERQALAELKVASFADDTYGSQLQDMAVPGLAAEGRVTIAYTEERVTLAGGETIMLRKPQYSVTDLGYGPLGSDTTLSPRAASPMIGMGLIEAIADVDILTRADPQDTNGDGISGRAARAPDHRTGELKLGRFGWKAQNASVRDQSSSAFVGDLGISTPDAPRHWGDCTSAQAQCRDVPNGVQMRLGDTEAPDPVLDLVTFYSENLAVPTRRDVDSRDVLRGKALFYGIGCIACHTPKYVTRRDAVNKAQAFQLIWPYSDFLLHDMGEGLADGQQVGDDSGREWRTPPLWGVGLTDEVNGHTFFLHDGRARNLTEAILWHGGEAERARNAFASAAPEARRHLIRFLESL
ncbi:di-heme oxidoredictase family protein [Ciceribacter azotifigens]|uniref:di-heme oxidoreductase family protein n=1 Tax=Ciceribacter azotifigens TaxID=2069303 RepID=UPI003A877AA1